MLILQYSISEMAICVYIVGEHILVSLTFIVFELCLKHQVVKSFGAQQVYINGQTAEQAYRHS